jgi:hypothetical protein
MGKIHIVPQDWLRSQKKKTLQIVGLEIEISKQGTPITGHWLPPSQTDYEMVDDVGLVEL